MPPGRPRNPNSTRQRVLDALKQAPGTASEIGALLGMDAQNTLRHIYSLIARYPVVKVGEIKGRRGKPQTIWALK